MVQSNSTCWMLIRGAADGCTDDRETFARRYAPVIRAYLGARWRGSSLLGELDDATQEVFLECFQEDGLLDRVDQGRGTGFRAFLFGATRIVALRIERRAARRRDRPAAESVDLDGLARDDATLSQAFDRAWARALLREAGRVQKERAEQAGEEALRRHELLRLRFQKNLPIREIARLWDRDPARLHKEYARARQEFRAALVEVVSFHHLGSATEVERQCAELLSLLLER